MTVEDYINLLKTLQVDMWLSGGDLEYTSPLATMTPEILLEINQYKTEIIEYLSQLPSTVTVTSTVIPHREFDGNARLSFGQERLWFQEQLFPNMGMYNTSESQYIRGPLHILALFQSLNHIVQRHEVLRTVYIMQNDIPHQKVLKQNNFVMPLIDLFNLVEEEGDVEISRLNDVVVNEKYDLSRDSVLRTVLVRHRGDKHALLLALHHIASDGWSSAIFWRELSALYDAYKTGQPATLSELSIHYADYAVWQRQRMQDEILNSDMAYWKEHLKGVTPLQLPKDYSRSSQPKLEGAYTEFALPEELTKTLLKLQQQTGVSLFMLMLAIFKVMLYKYSGQTDLVVSTPLANRNHVDVENIAGFFVNNLVIRTDLSGNPSFLEYLKQVRRICLDGYDHQELPFELLVAELDIERVFGVVPLVQVGLTVNINPTTSKLSGLILSAMHMHRFKVHLDLEFFLTRHKDLILGNVVYNKDLFKSTTIRRMVSHFTSLCQAVADDPNSTIHELRMISHFEEKEILSLFSQGNIYQHSEWRLLEIFNDVVSLYPDSIALVCADEHVTYRELNKRANRLAALLRCEGVDTEIRVALFMERSVDMVVAILGVMKAGGVYVPLNPQDPKERLLTILDDCNARVVLTQKHLMEAQSFDMQGRIDTTIMCINADQPGIAEKDVNDIAVNCYKEQLAYIIYTSGSTGTPKGVMVESIGLANTILALSKILDICHGCRLIHRAPFSFDAATAHLFVPLFSGATVCIKDRYEPLNEALLNQGITHALVQAPVLIALPVQSFPQLETISAGAAACPVETARTWSVNHRFLNVYGPTETSICATVGEYHRKYDKPPIGKALPNLCVFILDEDLNIVPVGLPGEIFISGLGVSRGYVNDPALTAERFLPDPYSSATGKRMYRTGDRACWLDDGNIEFLGRGDDQVKIRGYRVELGEIEAKLVSHPAIKQVVVTTFKQNDANVDQVVVAYVVLQGDAALSEEELRKYAQKTLPHYMVPTFYMFLSEMPLLTSGKSDRSALPEMSMPGGVPSSEYVAPSTPTEKELVKIVRKILGIDVVGVTDNLFELGAHSLILTQIGSMIRNSFGINLELRTLFEISTLAELAVIVDFLKIESGDDDGLRIA